MNRKEIYQVRKFWFVHDLVERPVFHWLSYIIRLAMGLIIPFVHSMINEFCCPCNNLGVFILHQECEFLHVVKGGKIRIFIIPPPPNEVGGGYTGFTLSDHPSVRPSVCRRHGFRSISRSLLWNFDFKFDMHVGDFQWRHFQNGRLVAKLDFLVSRL